MASPSSTSNDTPTSPPGFGGASDLDRLMVSAAGIKDPKRKADVSSEGQALATAREVDLEKQGSAGRAKLDKENPVPKDPYKTWDEKPPEPDTLKSFASFASLLGLFAGALTHTPLTTALNASAAAMTAQRDWDLKKYAEAKDAFKTNMEIMGKNLEQESRARTAAFDLFNKDMDGGLAALRAVNAQFGNQAAAAITNLNHQQEISMQQARLAQEWRVHIDSMKKEFRENDVDQGYVIKEVRKHHPELTTDEAVAEYMKAMPQTVRQEYTADADLAKRMDEAKAVAAQSAARASTLPYSEFEAVSLAEYRRDNNNQDPPAAFLKDLYRQWSEVKPDVGANARIRVDEAAAGHKLDQILARGGIQKELAALGNEGKEAVAKIRTSNNPNKYTAVMEYIAKKTQEAGGQLSASEYAQAMVEAARAVDVVAMDREITADAGRLAVAQTNASARVQSTMLSGEDRKEIASLHDQMRLKIAGDNNAAKQVEIEARSKAAMERLLVKDENAQALAKMGLDAKKAAASLAASKNPNKYTLVQEYLSMVRDKNDGFLSPEDFAAATQKMLGYISEGEGQSRSDIARANNERAVAVANIGEQGKVEGARINAQGRLDVNNIQINAKKAAAEAKTAEEKKTLDKFMEPGKDGMSTMLEFAKMKFNKPTWNPSFGRGSEASALMQTFDWVYGKYVAERGGANAQTLNASNIVAEQGTLTQLNRKITMSEAYSGVVDKNIGLLEDVFFKYGLDMGTKPLNEVKNAVLRAKGDAGIRELENILTPIMLERERILQGGELSNAQLSVAAQNDAHALMNSSDPQSTIMKVLLLNSQEIHGKQSIYARAYLGQQNKLAGIDEPAPEDPYYPHPEAEASMQTPGTYQDPRTGMWWVRRAGEDKLIWYPSWYIAAAQKRARRGN